MGAGVRGVQGVVANLRRASHTAGVGKVEAMHRALRHIEAIGKGRFLSAPRGPAIVLKGKKGRELVLLAGGVGGLAANTGALRASFVAEVLPPVDGKVVGVWGTAVRWAHVHEYGMTIFPKGGGFLYIPVRSQRGGTAARRGAAGKDPRSGVRANSVIRVRSVRIPAREPMKKTLQASDPLVRAEFQEYVHRVVRAGEGG